MIFHHHTLYNVWFKSPWKNSHFLDYHNAADFVTLLDSAPSGWYFAWNSSLVLVFRCHLPSVTLLCWCDCLNKTLRALQGADPPFVSRKTHSCWIFSNEAELRASDQSLDPSPLVWTAFPLCVFSESFLFRASCQRLQEPLQSQHLSETQLWSVLSGYFLRCMHGNLCSLGPVVL